MKDVLLLSAWHEGNPILVATQPFVEPIPELV